MHKFAAYVGLALIVAIGAGCASTSQTAGSAKQLGYARIGVVSVAAQTFSRQYVGVTAAGNETEQVDSAGWGVDGAYAQQVADALGEVTQADVVQGGYSAAEFAPLFAPMGADYKAAEKPLRAYCTRHKTDAVLAVYPASANDFLGNTNHVLRGAGMYAHGSRVSALALIAAVGMFDCASVRLVAWRNLATRQDGAPGQIVRASPYTAIPKTLTRSPLEKLTAAQRATIKEALINLPEKAWAPTLHALFDKKGI